MKAMLDLPSSRRVLRVGLVVGTPLSDTTVRCGVRDYALRLAAALAERGTYAEVEAPAAWSLPAVRDWVAAMRSKRFDVLHVQYPAIGYRYSLTPHALGLMKIARRCVVTLHEYSALPSVQRIANQAFRASTNGLVFTTDLEAKAFAKGRRRHGARIIPIGSNIPVGPPVSERENLILYFGQIRPGKGVEPFLALAGLFSRIDPGLRFAVVGSTPPRWDDYARSLRSEAPATVEWVGDVQPETVAEIMARACAAYLPFPDGASWRRGSLVAALANRLPVIAPIGANTPHALGAVLFAADTPEAALDRVSQIRSCSTEAQSRSEAGAALVRPLQWDWIAERHTEFYQSIWEG